jgi:hypothetical protein
VMRVPRSLLRRPRSAAGAALVLSIVIAGSTLAASRGAPWRVGYVETIATYTTGLSGSLAGSVLQITNTNLSTTATAARAIAAITRARRSVALLAQNTAGGPAAHFLVGTTTALSSAAPFITNARGLVTNLNADLLDGLTSADFLRATGKAADADKLDGLDSTALQKRVTGACTAGSMVTAVNADGTVVCAADAGTTYTGTDPITVSGSAIGLAGTGRCAAGDVYKFGGIEGEERGWACGPDAVDGGNAATLDGADSATTNTAGTIVKRDASGNFAASTISAKVAAEAWHEIGTSGEPPFMACRVVEGAPTYWTNWGPDRSSAAFYKDPSGVVHLKGMIKCAGGQNYDVRPFLLPAGYRPALTQTHTTMAGDAAVRLDVTADGWLWLNGFVPGAANYLSLDGITFRAAS